MINIKITEEKRYPLYFVEEFRSQKICEFHDKVVSIHKEDYEFIMNAHNQWEKAQNMLEKMLEGGIDAGVLHHENFLNGRHKESIDFWKTLMEQKPILS